MVCLTNPEDAPITCDNVGNLFTRDEKTPEELDYLWEQLSSESLSEEKKDEIRESTVPYCTMKTLQDNNVVLYRVAKSNEKIAMKSAEKRPYIKCEAGHIAETKNPMGLSMTTSQCLISCLRYGDVVVEVDFSSPLIQQHNLCQNKVRQRGQMLGEYYSRVIPITRTYSLDKPETLAMVIKLASPSSLTSSIFAPKETNLNAYLKSFGFNDTCLFWNKIQERYKKLMDEGKSPTQCTNIIKEETDSILLSMTCENSLSQDLLDDYEDER